MNTTETLTPPSASAGDSALDCEGYRKLLASVEDSERRYSGSHDYRAKFAWIIARAQHYAERTGLSPEAILDAWESKRSYWFMNFYQDCNQPEIKDEKVRVFATVEDLRASIGDAGFRCPMCRAVTKGPYECKSGAEMSPGKICDWKVYGLFGHLGKGVAIFVKEKVAVQNIFMPIAWEQTPNPPSATAGE